MEGGKYTGKAVFETARAFAKMGRLWQIHFQNVVESYVGDGYTGMKKLLPTRVDADFRGILIADLVHEWSGYSRLLILIASRNRFRRPTSHRRLR
jgi:hypothetical protein